MVYLKNSLVSRSLVFSIALYLLKRKQIHDQFFYALPDYFQPNPKEIFFYSFQSCQIGFVCSANPRLRPNSVYGLPGA